MAQSKEEKYSFEVSLLLTPPSPLPHHVRRRQKRHKLRRRIARKYESASIVGVVGGLLPGTGKMAAMLEIDTSVEEVCKQVGASNLAVQCVASFRTAVSDPTLWLEMDPRDLAGA